MGLGIPSGRRIRGRGDTRIKVLVLKVGEYSDTQILAIFPYEAFDSYKEFRSRFDLGKIHEVPSDPEFEKSLEGLSRSEGRRRAKNNRNEKVRSANKKDAFERAGYPLSEDELEGKTYCDLSDLIVIRAVQHLKSLGFEEVEFEEE